MSPFQIQPQCYACLTRLLDLTLTLATEDAARRAAVRRQTRAVLEAAFTPKAIPARLATTFHRQIMVATGNADPFLPKKQQETALAKQVAAQLTGRQPRRPEDLLALAAVGNALDFFSTAADLSPDMLRQVNFPAAARTAWENSLRRGPGLLLYLADNAGEQFFDLPLVQFLRSGGWQVYYVVKGGPIQNDLTGEDLAASGLAEALAPVLSTGAATVGLDLTCTSSHFKELFRAADLILAKGMGHFETLAHLDDPRLFFLLRAKCQPVAAALGVPRHSFVLRQA